MEIIHTGISKLKPGTAENNTAESNLRLCDTSALLPPQAMKVKAPDKSNDFIHLTYTENFIIQIHNIFPPSLPIFFKQSQL